MDSSVIATHPQNFRYSFEYLVMNLLKTIFLLLTATPLVQAQTQAAQQTVTYVDSTRNRKLVTEIWWPPDEKKSSFPLVMFSHGTGGNRLASQWFCAGLANKGFIVAAVDHFGNTYDNPIPIEFVSIWKRPQDISFVLSRLLAEKQFAARINESDIFAAGFSLGGYTALALVGAEINGDELITFFKSPRGRPEIEIPEMPGLINLFEQDDIVSSLRNNASLKDKRIRGAFVMAPAAGQGFTSPAQMKNVDVPVFIVGANSDKVAPVETNAKHYKNLLSDAKWYLIDGKPGHYVFLNEGNDDLKKNAPIFFSDDASVDRAEIHAKVIALAEGFLNEILK